MRKTKPRPKPAAKSPPRALSLIDKVKALPIRRLQKIWFDHLPKKTQAELLRFRAAYQREEFPQSKSQIVDALREAYSLDAKRESILAWLRGGR